MKIEVRPILLWYKINITQGPIFYPQTLGSYLRGLTFFVLRNSLVYHNVTSVHTILFILYSALLILKYEIGKFKFLNITHAEQLPGDNYVGIKGLNLFH